MNITYTQNGDYLIPNIVIRKTIACRFLVPRIYALSGGISSNEKRGRLHILLLIIRNF